MIETIAGLPDNVVGFIAKGQLTKKDYEDVLIPTVEDALKRRHKVRLYYELGSQLTGIDAGAAWEDTKIGMEHLTRWERIAVVTNVDWIKYTVNTFRFVLPGDIRVFPTTQAAAARSWIVSPEN